MDCTGISGRNGPESGGDYDRNTQEKTEPSQNCVKPVQICALGESANKAGKQKTAFFNTPSVQM